MTTRASENASRYQNDQELARRAAAGELEAWQDFLLRYSTLIFKVVRRHLVAEDDDEVRTVYVDILKALYDGDLAKYRDISALSTWLTLYARRRSIDALRARHGRQRNPASLRHLDAFDYEVFQLYYVERLPIEVVVHTLDWKGHEVSTEQLAAALGRIESTVDRRVLRRLEDEHWERKNGKGRRLFGYVLHLQQQYETRAGENSPDRFLSETEIERMAEQVRRAVSKLERDEQRVVELRFARGLEAGRISRELGMLDRRQAYAVIERVVRKLREALSSSA